MNLWAKRSIRQLAVLAVALFFFSCEDETSLLGFKNPNPKFKVSYIEIPVGSSVLLIDSIVTDNKEGNLSILKDYSVLVGQYNDAVAGTLRAEAYLQMLPSTSAKLDATSIYDSVTFQSRLTFYAYGFTGSEQIKFNVHEITQDSLDRTPSSRYYFNSSFQYDPTPLGEAVVSVIYDSLRKQAVTNPTRQDTILAKARLSDSFGTRLFNLAYNDPDGKLSDARKFIYEIKGLALSPSGNNGVLGLNSLTGLSKVILHYHTVGTGGVITNLERAFIFSGSVYDPNFTNITTDRSSTELSGPGVPYQSFQPGSGLRIVQNGSAIITKLDLSKFYTEFADTIDNAVINLAELIISDVESPAGFTAHSTLAFKVMSPQHDMFTNYQTIAEREALLPYYVSRDVNRYLGNFNHYFPKADDATPITLGYVSEKKQYSGFMTLFIQNLFNNKGKETINENRIRFLGLYPVGPSAGYSVNRTVFNAGNVKLRIYYTKPTTIAKSN